MGFNNQCQKLICFPCGERTVQLLEDVLTKGEFLILFEKFKYILSCAICKALVNMKKLVLYLKDYEDNHNERILDA